jgi:hypothetical protein
MSRKVQKAAIAAGRAGTLQVPAGSNCFPTVEERFQLPVAPFKSVILAKDTCHGGVVN